MANFGEILSELRQDHRLSQKELAEILHLSVSTISNYETGRHLPDLDTVLEIAEFFSVSADYLLGRVSQDIPVKKLNELFIEGKTYSDALEALYSLRPEQKLCIYQIVDALRFRYPLSDDK